MSRLDAALDKRTGKRPGPPCSVSVVLDVLAATAPAERDALDAWLEAGDARRGSDSDMADALADLEELGSVHVSQQQIGRHRRRNCRCFK